MSFKVLDVKQFTNLDDLVDQVAIRFPLQSLAKKLGLSPSSCHATLYTHRQRVYRQIKGWKSLLGVTKEDGYYLELLALIKAFPQYAQKMEMLERAYLIVSKLQDTLDPDWKSVSGLLYALDPLVPIVRNLTDLKDFPINESEIPRFAQDQVIWLKNKSGPKRTFQARVKRTWTFLKTIDAVYFSDQLDRWEKSSPVIWTPWKNKELHDSLLRMRHYLYLQEFTDILFDPDCLFSTALTLAVPEKHLGLVEQLISQFHRDLLERLSFALNSDFLHHLKGVDEGHYLRVLDYISKLSDQGILFDPATMDDKHCLLRIASIGRRITQ